MNKKTVAFIVFELVLLSTLANGADDNFRNNFFYNKNCAKGTNRLAEIRPKIPEKTINSKDLIG